MNFPSDPEHHMPYVLYLTLGSISCHVYEQGTCHGMTARVYRGSYRGIFLCVEQVEHNVLRTMFFSIKMSGRVLYQVSSTYMVKDGLHPSEYFSPHLSH